MVYVYVEYPKWKYHPDKPAVMVEDADSEKALGPDWYDQPWEASAALEKVKQEVKRRT